MAFQTEKQRRKEERQKDAKKTGKRIRKESRKLKRMAARTPLSAEERALLGTPDPNGMKCSLCWGGPDFPVVIREASLSSNVRLFWGCKSCGVSYGVIHPKRLAEMLGHWDVLDVADIEGEAVDFVHW